MYAQKCSTLFEYFYEAYPERDSSASALAG